MKALVLLLLCSCATPGYRYRLVECLTDAKTPRCMVLLDDESWPSCSYFENAINSTYGAFVYAECELKR